jgi:hypothetical protein
LLSLNTILGNTRNLFKKLKNVKVASYRIMKIKCAKQDKYKPTHSEKKLLEVLINPNNIGKSITERCNLAAGDALF